MNYLTSGELAKLFGITKYTLRYYVDKGLIQPQQMEENGYFYFSDADIYLLYQAISLRKIGFSVEEVKKNLAKPSFSNSFSGLLKQTRKQIEELTYVRDLLRLDEIVFIERQGYFLKKLAPEWLVPPFQLNLKSLVKNKEMNFDILDELFYLPSKQCQEWTIYSVGTQADYDLYFKQGTYAVKSFLAKNTEEFNTAIQEFITDSIFELGLAYISSMVVRENIPLSLSYSEQMVYSIEVRMR